ncbi:tripartite tricarboxylate transporter substrate-binding protein [Vibrio sp. CDRSL-10 TSBA]
MPEYPNVPTLKELGYDISLSNWRGIVAPAGVSDEVKAAWNKAIKEATSDKKFIAMMKNQGSVVDYQASGKELDERMKTTALSFIETAQKLKN